MRGMLSRPARPPAWLLRRRPRERAFAFYGDPESILAVWLSRCCTPISPSGQRLPLSPLGFLSRHKSSARSAVGSPAPLGHGLRHQPAAVWAGRWRGSWRPPAGRRTARGNVSAWPDSERANDHRSDLIAEPRPSSSMTAPCLQLLSGCHLGGRFCGLAGLIWERGGSERQDRHYGVR